MNADDFRELSLSLPEATESAHMGHPDFRVRGKVFATLGYPDEDHGVVKLTPDQQKLFVRTEPRVYRPVKGAWGQRGSTTICLPQADEASVRQALLAAWRNTAPKRLAREFEEE